MGIVLALALIAVNLVFVKLFDKGVYIAYAMSFLIGAMGVMLSLLRPHTAKQRLSFAGFLATAAATPLVANHWGGTSGLWVSLATVLIVLVLVFLNRSIKRPLWTPNIRHAAILAFVSMIFFLSVPIAGNSYFVSERFSDKSGAVRDRMSHWQDALNMMDAAPLAQLFGMGVGRFPALYFWRSSRTSPPGTFTLMDEFGNGFLRLGGTRDDLGGVVLYYAQRIRPEPYRTLIFSFDVRSTFKNASIQVGLCESLLLYTENCETKSARLTKTDGSWQRMDFPLTTRTLGAWHKYGKRPVQAWLVNPVGATHVDIDNVRLTDTAGTNLLKNGDFSEGGDHWLFSVSNFWPWHIESIWVHTVFEQGWVGLAVLLVLILYAVGRLLLLIRQGQLVALALFVSFAGFLTVGTFNSLFEFPRVALLFYLALFIALTRWGDDSAAIRRARDERGLDRETPV